MLLLDIRMPGEDGFQVVRAIRKKTRVSRLLPGLPMPCPIRSKKAKMQDLTSTLLAILEKASGRVRMWGFYKFAREICNVLNGKYSIFASVILVTCLT